MQTTNVARTRHDALNGANSIIRVDKALRLIRVVGQGVRSQERPLFLFYSFANRFHRFWINHTMKSVVGLIIGVLVTLLGWSQDRNIVEQDLVWYRYRNILRIDSTWSISTEIENRRFLSPHRSHQLLPGRVALHHKLGKGWEAGVGFVYFLQCLPHDPDVDIAIIRPEIRPHQELVHRTRSGPWQFRQRIRIEERFFRKTEGDELVEGYRFNWRFRYRIRADYRFWEKESRYFSVYAFDELMVNAGNSIQQNFFDQNRIAGGFHYSITPSWALDLAYIHWFQQRSSGVDFFSRNILRITITQYLAL